MFIFCINEGRVDTLKTEQLIKKLAKKQFNIEDNIIRKNGKPYFENIKKFIGVSHTNDLTLIAFADFEFGIDIERKDRIINNKEKIISKYFSKEEQKEDFIDIWVKKEAYLKFLGVGIRGLENSDTTKLCGAFTKVEIAGYSSYIFSKNSVNYVFLDTSN